jgi:arsenate reductase
MRAYRTLRARIEAFLALPLETLQHDPPALKAAMDRIAAITGA